MEAQARLPAAHARAGRSGGASLSLGGVFAGIRLRLLGTIYCRLVDFLAGVSDSLCFAKQHPTHPILNEIVTVLGPVFRPEHRSLCPNWPVRGAAGCRAFSKGHGWPFREPRTQARSAGNRRKSGGLSFWILFLWTNKEKVSRPPVREPALKQSCVAHNFIRYSM